MKLMIEVEIPCSAEKYWKMIYTEHFEKFQIKFLGVEDTWESENILMKKDGGYYLKRTVVVLPSVKIPGALKRLLNDKFSYKELQEKRLDRCETTWKTVPPVFPDQVKSHGVVYLEPIDETKCKQVLDAEFGSSFPFGFSGVFERIITSELKKTYEVIPNTVREYIKYCEETEYDVDTNFDKFIAQKKKEYRARIKEAKKEGTAKEEKVETDEEKASRIAKEKELSEKFEKEGCVDELADALKEEVSV